MSAQQDSLRSAQEARENKYTLAFKKNTSEGTPVQKQLVSALEQTPKPKFRGSRAIFTTLVFLIFVVNIGIFFTLRTYASKEKEGKSINRSSQTKVTKAKVIKPPAKKISDKSRKPTRTL